MKIIQDKYRLLKEGKITKRDFIREARMHFPSLVTNSATFKEAESILKQRRVITEAMGQVISNLQQEPDWFKVFNENMGTAKKALSDEEVDRLYNDYPELDDPYFPGRESIGSDEEYDEGFETFKIEVGGNTYMVDSDPTKGDTWYLKENEGAQYEITNPMVKWVDAHELSFDEIEDVEYVSNILSNYAEEAEIQFSDEELLDLAQQYKDLKNPDSRFDEFDSKSQFGIYEDYRGDDNEIQKAIRSIVTYNTLPPQIDYVQPFKTKADKAEEYLRSLPNGEEYMKQAGDEIEEYHGSDAPYYDSLFEAKKKKAKTKKKPTGAKAEEKKTSKEVTDVQANAYDQKDDKNLDNLFGGEFFAGYYAEAGDPKNKDKTIDQLKDIVAKNLRKDRLYYVRNGQFGMKDLGYSDEAPGLKASKSDQMVKVKLKEAYGKGRFKDNVASKEAAMRFLKKKTGNPITFKKKGESYWLYDGKKKVGIWKEDTKKLTFDHSLNENKTLPAVKENIEEEQYIAYDAGARYKVEYEIEKYDPTNNKPHKSYGVNESVYDTISNPKQYAKQMIADFAGVPVHTLGGFKFDGTDDMEKLRKVLNFTNVEGTKLYYDQVIKTSNQDLNESRKPPSWDESDIDTIDNADVDENLPRYKYEDIYYMGDEPTDYFFNSPKEDEFIMTKKDKEYLINTSGYDYARYVKLIFPVYDRDLNEDGYHDSDDLEQLKQNAAEMSAEGYSVHINKNARTGGYSISDWYDSDSTVASFENGEQLNEETEYVYGDTKNLKETKMIKLVDLLAEAKDEKEPKKKKSKVSDKIKEIEQGGSEAALEAKMAAIDEEINIRETKIATVTENEDIAEFVNPARVKEMQKEIKELEKAKGKYEKMYEKMTGGKQKEVIDETDDEEVDEAGVGPYTGYYGKYEGDIDNNGPHDEKLFDLFLKYIKDPDDAEIEYEMFVSRGVDGLSDDVYAQLQRDPEFKKLAPGV